MCEIITIPLFSVIFLFCSRFGTRERDSSKLVNNESIADKLTCTEKSLHN